LFGKIRNFVGRGKGAEAMQNFSAAEMAQAWRDILTGGGTADGLELAIASGQVSVRTNDGTFKITALETDADGDSFLNFQTGSETGVISLGEQSLDDHLIFTTPDGQEYTPRQLLALPQHKPVAGPVDVQAGRASVAAGVDEVAADVEQPNVMVDLSLSSERNVSETVNAARKGDYAALERAITAGQVAILIDGAPLIATRLEVLPGGETLILAKGSQSEQRYRLSDSRIINALQFTIDGVDRPILAADVDEDRQIQAEQIEAVDETDVQSAVPEERPEADLTTLKSVCVRGIKDALADSGNLGNLQTVLRTGLLSMWSFSSNRHLPVVDVRIDEETEKLTVFSKDGDSTRKRPLQSAYENGLLQLAVDSTAVQIKPDDEEPDMDDMKTAVFHPRHVDVDILGETIHCEFVGELTDDEAVQVDIFGGNRGALVLTADNRPVARVLSWDDPNYKKGGTMRVEVVGPSMGSTAVRSGDKFKNANFAVYDDGDSWGFQGFRDGLKVVKFDVNEERKILDFTKLPNQTDVDAVGIEFEGAEGLHVMVEDQTHELCLFYKAGRCYRYNRFNSDMDLLKSGKFPWGRVHLTDDGKLQIFAAEGKGSVTVKYSDLS
jgi:hypothetical protein